MYNSIVIKILWSQGISLSDVLIYIGTILIGFELVRKINRFELMLVLVAVWPISPIINAFPTTEQQRARFKWKKIIKSFSIIKFVYTVLLLPILLPISLIALLAFIITELINAIEKLLNIFWYKLIHRFEKAMRKFAGILIQREKRYHGLQARSVVRTLQNEKIPFLPIIGIALIIIGVFLKIHY